MVGQRPGAGGGHRPANIALDLLGQARALLSYAGEVEGAGRDEDDLAYLREEREFRNCQLVEQPNGDFAPPSPASSTSPPTSSSCTRRCAARPTPTLAALAAKAVKEVAYHRDHADQWTLRLGDGTEESHARMQRGLDALWPYAGELFEPDEVVQRLAAAGTAVDPATLRDGWDRHLDADPGRGHPGPPGRRLAARQRPPRRPQRAPGLPAGRDAVPAPPAPGSALVSAQRGHRGGARELAGRVVDPEIPVLTIEDLGILRDVAVDDDGNVEVTVTPTYSGCPAMDVIRDDVDPALARARLRRGARSGRCWPPPGRPTG